MADNLSHKRGAIRRYLNRLLDRVTEALGTEPKDMITLATLKVQIEEKNTHLIELNADIEDRIETTADLDKEFDSQNEYSEKVARAIVMINAAIGSNQIIGTPNTSFIDNAGVVSTPIATTASVKLPKITIEKFSGDVSKWQTFWSQFDTTVNKNTSIGKAEKFTYLQSYLTGQAANSIAGLALTDANYDSALEILKSRFGRKDLIINTHMNELLNVKPVRKSSDVAALRKLIDNLETRICGLNAMGVGSGTFGALLCPVLLRSLPEDIALEYTRKTESVGSDIDDLVEFLRKEINSRERTSLIVKAEPAPKESQGFKDYGREYFKPNKEKLSSAAALNTSFERKCLFCDSKEHQSYQCDMNIDEKYTHLKKSGRCFNCFGSGHRSSNCRSRRTCKYCHRKHHQSLCLKQTKNVIETVTPVSAINEETKVITKSDDVSTNTINEKSHAVFLQTINVSINGKLIRCLLDGGSQRSFIVKSVAKHLPVIGSENLNILSFGEKQEKQKTDYDKVRVHFDLDNELIIEALVVPTITRATLPSLEPAHFKQITSELFGAQNIEYNDSNEEIQLLIGSDYYWKIVTGHIKPHKSGIVAIETIFGWIFHGKASIKSASNMIFTGITTSEILSQLKQFWELESIGIKDEEIKLSNEEKTAVEKFNETVNFKNGRYEVSLIWRNQEQLLCDNYDIAFKRFKSLQKRFQRDNAFFQRYKDVIDDQLKQGIIEKMPRTDNFPVYFVPHQAVINEEKESTKLRVVYDASSHSPGEQSLNSCLYEGPNLNPLLIQVLLNFRKYKYGLMADIKQAFLQISIREKDRDAVRFLWSHEADKEPEEYRLTRVLFGSRSSPFLLTATLRHHLIKYTSTDKKLVEMMDKSLYVDDLITGADSVEEATYISKRSSEILKEAGMELTKFCTHSNVLIDKWKEMDVKTKQINNKEPAVVQKVLGISWNLEHDQLYFDFEKLKQFASRVGDTKRELLMTSARVFDPFGMLSPFVVTIKMLYQRLWTSGLNWDDQLNKEMREEWHKWLEQLREPPDIMIPRHYFKLTIPSTIELHAFSDASEKAYGAVVYLRYKINDEFNTSFVIAKSKVSPVKRITLPRLELMGAVILGKLIKTVTNCLKIKSKIHAWTDSMIVLHWIKGNPREWKTFVNNRVSEITNIVEPSYWYHCSGKDNPADLLSRGISLESLKKSSLWWNGPQWLTQESEHWPRTNIKVISNVSINKEKRKIFVAQVIDDCNETIIDINRFGSLTKLLRTTVYVFRFIAKCQNKNINDKIIVNDIMKAEEFWIKQVQKLAYKHEVSRLSSGSAIERTSSLYQFSPFIDENGIVRFGGRIHLSHLPFRSRHPIILPNNSRLCILIIEETHHRLMHAGVTHVLSNLREKYFIPKCRAVVKKIVNKCMKCRIFNSRRSTVKVAPLPENRLMPAPPFTVIGLDFAGPLFLRDKSKVYICLFTCAVTRAVHLELAHDMTANTFLMALKRMIGRRGVPSKIYSDNAKTFKRADRFLRELFEGNDNKINDFCSTHHIEWIYIAERAAWWGGFWERLVRSIKTPLRKLLGKALLTYDELETLLIEIEQILNSRPLSSLGADEPAPAVTPADLLIGKPLTNLPDINDHQIEEFKEDDVTKRYKFRQRLINQFWQRWRKEYLLELNANRFHDPGRATDLSEGELVLVVDDNLKRQQWKMGIIVKLHKGVDGQTRACSVRLPNRSVITRAVPHLCKLEIRAKD